MTEPCRTPWAASRLSPISAKLSSKYETPRTWKQALQQHEAILRAPEAGDHDPRSRGMI